MNAVKYYRCRAGLSRAALCGLSGLSKTTLAKLEIPCSHGHELAEYYLQLSYALGVPVDELLRSEVPDVLPEPLHHLSRTEDPFNPICRYRHEKNLTFERLGVLLGNKTKETARLACCGGVGIEKHIETLARHEHMTPEEFRNVYGA